jgi:hypothetical protein
MNKENIVKNVKIIVNQTYAGNPHIEMANSLNAVL